MKIFFQGGGEPPAARGPAPREGRSVGATFQEKFPPGLRPIRDHSGSERPLGARLPRLGGPGAEGAPAAPAQPGGPGSAFRKGTMRGWAGVAARDRRSSRGLGTRTLTGRYFSIALPIRATPPQERPLCSGVGTERRPNTGQESVLRAPRGHGFVGQEASIPLLRPGTARSGGGGVPRACALLGAGRLCAYGLCVPGRSLGTGRGLRAAGHRGGLPATHTAPVPLRLARLSKGVSGLSPDALPSARRQLAPLPALLRAPPRGPRPRSGPGAPTRLPAGSWPRPSRAAPPFPRGGGPGRGACRFLLFPLTTKLLDPSGAF